MNNKIALEEAWAPPDLAAEAGPVAQDDIGPEELVKRMGDVMPLRLAEMDRHGIALMVLSGSSPGVQAVADPTTAQAEARRINNGMAAEIAKAPDRFAGFAALSMHDADMAARELRRAVEDLGFKGALLNSFQQSGTDGETCLYYDLPEYEPFWAEVERLDVPVYLHPRNPLPSRAKEYDGHPWLLAASWAFAAEVSVHALRLIGSGLFDRHPGAQLILGHLGERIPYDLWRLDHNIARKPQGYPAKRPMRDYFRTNVSITTSGNFWTPTLQHAIAEIGADRILFSVDYPFEWPETASNWFDNAPITEDDRRKIGRGNAARLLGIAP